MKNYLIHFLMLFSVITGGCKKEHIIDTPPDENPFKITALLPLTDNIPYQELGSRKILFERFYDHSVSVFYIIDIDKRKSTGFKLKSLITQPSISPSGTRIGCALLNSGDVGSAWNVYIMNLDGSDCVPAFISDQDAYYPTWNKDGSKIIFFTSGPAGVLYMQSPVENSSDRVELTKFQYNDDLNWLIIPSGGFAVSSEGNLIGISKSDKLSGIIGIKPYIGKTGVKILLSPSTDLGFVSPNFSVESPVFSPDGLKIAFISIYTNPLENDWISASINIMNPDGTNLISVGGIGGYKSEISNPRYMSLAWSPDGTRILFSLPDGKKTSHLFIVNLDGTGYYQITNELNAFDCEVS